MITDATVSETPFRIKVCVPTVPLPERLRLGEIVIDTTLGHLCLCTGRGDDDFYGMFDTPDQCRAYLKLSDLMNCRVFSDRWQKHGSIMAGFAIMTPTIEVNRYTGQPLIAGELWLDTNVGVLYVGCPIDNAVSVKCVRVVGCR